MRFILGRISSANEEEHVTTLLPEHIPTRNLTDFLKRVFANTSQSTIAAQVQRAEVEVVQELHQLMWSSNLQINQYVRIGLDGMPPATEWRKISRTLGMTSHPDMRFRQYTERDTFDASLQDLVHWYSLLRTRKIYCFVDKEDLANTMKLCSMPLICLTVATAILHDQVSLLRRAP